MHSSSSKKKSNNDTIQNINNYTKNNLESERKERQNNIEEKSEIESLKITLNNNLPKPKNWNQDKIQSLGYHKVFLGYLNAYLIIVQSK